MVKVEGRSGNQGPSNFLLCLELPLNVQETDFSKRRRRGVMKKKILTMWRRGGWWEVGVTLAVRWDPLTADFPSQRLLRWTGGPRSISAWKPHTHKALKAALMPHLGISYLLARLIIPPSTGAGERRHRGWAGKIGLHSQPNEKRLDKESRWRGQRGRGRKGGALLYFFLSFFQFSLANVPLLFWIFLFN